MSKEYCDRCDDETGNAGQGEDSIYIELDSGEMVGPLCDTCYETIISCNKCGAVDCDCGTMQRERD